MLTTTTNDDDDDDDGRKDGDGDIDNCELNLFFLKMDHLHHRMEIKRAPIKGPWAGRTLTRMPPVLVNNEILVAVDTTLIDWHE